MATESDYILATHDMNGYKAPYTGFCEHYWVVLSTVLLSTVLLSTVLLSTLLDV
jgi:hypothetical protein